MVDLTGTTLLMTFAKPFLRLIRALPRAPAATNKRIYLYMEWHSRICMEDCTSSQPNSHMLASSWRHHVVCVICRMCFWRFDLSWKNMEDRGMFYDHPLPSQCHVKFSNTWKNGPRINTPIPIYNPTIPLATNPIQPHPPFQISPTTMHIHGWFFHPTHQKLRRTNRGQHRRLRSLEPQQQH